jgi:hypothetical protein
MEIQEISDISRVLCKLEEITGTTNIEKREKRVTKELLGNNPKIIIKNKSRPQKIGAGSTQSRLLKKKNNRFFWLGFQSHMFFYSFYAAVRLGLRARVAPVR